MPRTTIAAAATTALLLAGCASGADAPSDAPEPASSPTASPTLQPVVMTKDDAFTVSLAAVAPLRDGWTGASTGTVEGATVCDDRPDLGDLDDSVYVVSESVDRQADGPVTGPLERLRAIVVPIPEGKRDAAVAAVHGLLDCDATTSEGTSTTTASADVGGVEVVTVAERLTQKAKPKVAHRVFTVAVVDGLTVLCVADGTSEPVTTRAATDCTTRAMETVAIVRAGALPDEGSVASSAVLAGRLRPTEDTAVQSSAVVGATPCYGEDLVPPTTGVVTTQRDTGQPFSPAGVVLVQPFDGPGEATAELGRYRQLAEGCTGEIVLYEATAATPEYRVTRTSAGPTDTGDGGVRFESFFGTRKKRQGTSQVTEVFALGPHLVFVSGEGDDLDQARARVDAAIDDVVTAE